MSRLRRLLPCVTVAAAIVTTVALYGRQDPPPDKGKRVEEEEDNFKLTRPVLKIEETELVDRASRRFPRPAVDLKQAAHDAKHVAVRKIYNDLSVPHDLVIYKNKDRAPQRIQPLEQYIGSRVENLRASIDVVPLEDEWKPGKQLTVGPAVLESVRHYEQLARSAVNDLLRDETLTHELRLAAAEQILSVAMTYNASSRKGDAWKGEETALKELMAEVLLRQLAELRDWDETADLALRLANYYSEQEETRRDATRVRVAVTLTELLNRAASEPTAATSKLREVRRLARQLVDQYPNNDKTKLAATTLRRQAQSLFEQSRKLFDEKKLADAEELLSQAEDTDSLLPELRDFRRKLNESNPILRVAVRELPRYLSPGWATTDSELRAVELLFESLVKVVPAPDGSMQFRPSLADGRPRIVTLGRQFHIPRGALWSPDKDNKEKEITPADVRYSVELLKKGADGRHPAYGDLLEDLEVSDPTRVTLSLKEGFLEPLAMMTFKLVPDGTKAEDEALAKAPIGSGPFRFGGDGDEPGRGKYVSFVSNPTYGSRPGKNGKPRIREIRFYVVADPVKELKEGRIDLALDLTAKQRATLAQEKRVFVPTFSTLPNRPPELNRRIWFLAINHKGTTTLSSADCRRAVNLAINREELLNEHFRKGADIPVHRSINSPFPAGSWASKAAQAGRANLDPFDKTLATELFDKALGASGGKVKLQLKYPAGDAHVADALNDLRKQVLAASKDRLDLEPTPLDPHRLRDEIKAGQFDIAYWRYDYPDDTYWLTPLLGRRPGDNMLGYHGADLQSGIQRVQGRRDFERVRELTADVQRVFDADMPLVPLWQLDPLSAYRADLEPMIHDRRLNDEQRKELERVPYDPLLVFTDVENWRLVKK
jgi:ABC-type oligopeptide transport system substrate-binding subunit